MCYFLWTASEGSEGVSAEELEQQRKASVNKLLYRSRQRGFLEMDLLVGQWAEENVGKMKPEEFDLFAVVLDQENPDLFKWLTGQLEPPDNMLTNSTYRVLPQSLTVYLTMKQRLRGRGWKLRLNGCYILLAYPPDSLFITIFDSLHAAVCRPDIRGARPANLQ